MARFEHGGDTYGCPPDLLDCSINLNPMGAPGPVLEGACRAVLDCARYPVPRCRIFSRLSRRGGACPSRRFSEFLDSTLGFRPLSRRALHKKALH